MKKIISSLILLLSFVSTSYGAEGQDNGSRPGQHFDPILWYSSPYSPQLPLPHLPMRGERASERPETSLNLEDIEEQNTEEEERKKRRQEKEEDSEEQSPKRARLESSEQYTSSLTTDASLMSSDEPGYNFFADTENWLASKNWKDPLDDPSIKPGQELLQKIPVEVLAHLMQFLPPHALKQLALVSKAFRDQVQGNLTHLSIAVADITPETLQTMKNRFPRVKNLTVEGYGITPENIRLLKESFPDIVSLNLSDIGLTLEGVLALSEADTTFFDLKTLNLSENRLGNEAIKILAQAPFAEQLKELDLHDADINNDGVETLSQPNAFPALEALDLSGPTDTDVESDLVVDESAIVSLRDAPFAKQLKTLKLSNTNLAEDGITELSEKDAFPALKILDLGFNFNLDAYKTTVVQDLSQAPFANHLEQLNLADSNMDKDSVEVLFRPGNFPSLKILNLRKSELGTEEGTVEALSKASFANTLESLDLAENSLDATEVKTLFQQGKFSSLKSLDLSDNPIGDEGVKAIAETSFAKQLEILNLANTEITPTAIRILSQPDAFPKLKVLILRDNHIRDGDIKILAKAPFAKHLERLDLAKNSITDYGIIALSAPEAFLSLRDLALGYNLGEYISSKGIEALISAPFAKYLETLNLSHIAIMDTEAALLARGSFPALKILNLNSNEIEAAGLQALATATFAKQLKELYLRDNWVRDDDPEDPNIEDPEYEREYRDITISDLELALKNFPTLRKASLSAAEFKSTPLAFKNINIDWD